MSRPPAHAAEYDDAALVRRQAAIALRSLVRPGTYIGAVREVALTAVHAAAYPMGVARDGHRRTTPFTPPPGAEVAVADHDTAGMPIILVHGYVHNRSAFLGMSRALRKRGFRHIHAFDYNPLAYDIPEIAGMLAAEVERVLAVSGADRCMLVGHSMGGVIARYYVQQLGGHDLVDTVITLGAPHRGTYAAYLGVGRAVAQIRPGTTLLRKLQETSRPSDVRWVALYSDLDALVVPAVNAKLTHPALRATNIKLADLGHLSLLLSGEVLRTVVAHLADRTLNRHGQVATEVTPLPDRAGESDLAPVTALPLAALEA